MYKYFKRFLYLLYYIWQSELMKIKPFIGYSCVISGHSKFFLLYEAIISVFQYNISIKDYFYFRFFELDSGQKREWAGTGYLYEYQLKMNPKNSRKKLENKIVFLKHYKRFISRSFSTIEVIRENSKIAERLLNNDVGKLVLKGSCGQVGAEVEIICTKACTPDMLVEYMGKNNYDLVEEFVVQEDSLMSLSPSGLNTVRVFTQVYNGKVEILGACLRICVNSAVDNMAAGNIAAPIDEETGVVNGPGVYSDITKNDELIHPVTRQTIVGYQVPYWDKLLRFVKEVALYDTSNLSVGWDIAITNEGPELIEGNHNWCKLLWQLPVRKGLKYKLEKYL